jgi:hypothetical protein
MPDRPGSSKGVFFARRGHLYPSLYSLLVGDIELLKSSEVHSLNRILIDVLHLKSEVFEKETLFSVLIKAYERISYQALPVLVHTHFDLIRLLS